MLFTCLQVKSLWWGAAVKQQEILTWAAEVYSFCHSSSGHLCPRFSSIHHNIQMWDVCAEVRALQFTFREAQSYCVASVKCTRKNFIQIRWCSVCCCYLHVFSDLSLSQGWNGHHLDSASSCRHVNATSRHLIPGSLFH